MILYLLNASGHTWTHKKKEIRYLDQSRLFFFSVGWGHLNADNKLLLKTCSHANTWIKIIISEATYPKLKHTHTHASRWIISTPLLQGATRQVLLKRLSVFVYILLLTVALAEAVLFLQRVCSVKSAAEADLCIISANLFPTWKSCIDQQDAANHCMDLRCVQMTRHARWNASFGLI